MAGGGKFSSPIENRGKVEQRQDADETPLSTTGMANALRQDSVFHSPPKQNSDANNQSIVQDEVRKGNKSEKPPRSQQNGEQAPVQEAPKNWGVAENQKLQPLAEKSTAGETAEKKTVGLTQDSAAASNSARKDPSLQVTQNQTDARGADAISGDGTRKSLQEPEPGAGKLRTGGMIADADLRLNHPDPKQGQQDPSAPGVRVPGKEKDEFEKFPSSSLDRNAEASALRAAEAFRAQLAGQDKTAAIRSLSEIQRDLSTSSSFARNSNSSFDIPPVQYSAKQGGNMSAFQDVSIQSKTFSGKTVPGIKSSNLNDSGLGNLDAGNKQYGYSDHSKAVTKAESGSGRLDSDGKRLDIIEKTGGGSSRKLGTDGGFILPLPIANPFDRGGKIIGDRQSGPGGNKTSDSPGKRGDTASGNVGESRTGKRGDSETGKTIETGAGKRGNATGAGAAGKTSADIISKLAEPIRKCFDIKDGAGGILVVAAAKITETTKTFVVSVAGKIKLPAQQTQAFLIEQTTPTSPSNPGNVLSRSEVSITNKGKQFEVKQAECEQLEMQSRKEKIVENSPSRIKPENFVKVSASGSHRESQIVSEASARIKAIASELIVSSTESRSVPEPTVKLGDQSNNIGDPFAAEMLEQQEGEKTIEIESRQETSVREMRNKLRAKLRTRLRCLVKEGDDLESISLRYFGEDKYAPFIYHMNCKQIAIEICNSRKYAVLRPDSILTIPDEEDIQEFLCKKLSYDDIDFGGIRTANLEAARAKITKEQDVTQHFKQQGQISEHLSKGVKIVETECFNADEQGVRVSLELCHQSQWITVSYYEIFAAGSSKRQLCRTKKPAEMTISLPAAAVKSMAKSDFRKNYKAICDEFLGGQNGKVRLQNGID